jgi:hypothetical protein
MVTQHVSRASGGYVRGGEGAIQIAASCAAAMRMHAVPAQSHGHTQTTLAPFKEVAMNSEATLAYPFLLQGHANALHTSPRLNISSNE